ncbi:MULTISPECIES: hypothetical protein [unclassified Psychrobacillus]|uniref:hypothetical protein n=1 Tax=unclassified Psychrobacillus TaxID=2636677 RepID=UPI0030FA03A6
MKKYEVEITFANGNSQTQKADSNDNISAMNEALNRLEATEKAKVVNVGLICIGEY